MDLANHKWPGGKIAIMIIAIIALAAIVCVSLIRDRIVNPPQWQVSITGQGKVAYQPDIANITLGVQIDKVAKAEDALSQLNDKTNKIVAAIKGLGIADSDIQTQNYSLYPQYDYVNNVSSLAGYNANQQLLIKVRNIKDDSAKLSKVIAEATKAGSNQVIGVTFDVFNLEELKQQARVQAISDARKKASSLAKMAGVRLARIVGWWENVVQAPGINNGVYYGGSDKGGAGMGAGGAATPSLPTGSQEVIIEISVNYQIK